MTQLQSKLCVSCGEIKLFDAFNKSASKSDGLKTYCKLCSRRKYKEYSEANRERRKIPNREKQYRWKYGICRTQFAEMVSAANNKCEICGTRITVSNNKEISTTAVLDHCHITGVLRGVLCRKCNTNLGRMGDNAEMLLKAYQYLSKAAA